MIKLLGTVGRILLIDCSNRISPHPRIAHLISSTMLL